MTLFLNHWKNIVPTLNCCHDKKKKHFRKYQGDIRIKCRILCISKTYDIAEKLQYLTGTPK
eukprot:TRINITY_DN2485_c0_g2_i1.p2 TRINITY_DN2485_c0_g2~~TRINITY_DN2485_c0_g2_i1.p2  ORF type:complete len:61 (-),score=1.86 TRINITY_DN2485_c0_g2_i1:1059-1241(-)